MVFFGHFSLFKLRVSKSNANTHHKAVEVMEEGEPFVTLELSLIKYAGVLEISDIGIIVSKLTF